MGIDSDTTEWSAGTTGSKWDLAAVLFAMLFPSLATWLYFVGFAGQGELVRLSYGAAKLLEFAFPLLWVWLVQKQRIQPASPDRRGLGWGFGFGLLVTGALLGLYYGYLKDSPYFAQTHERVWAKIQEIGADTPATFFLLALFLLALHSLFEEYYWRWFVYGQLRRRLPLSVAAGVSGLAFALHHVIVIGAYLSPEHFWTATLFFSLCVAAGGVFWAWLYERTGSLYAPWLSHLLIDAGLMWIGYDLCRGYWP